MNIKFWLPDRGKKYILKCESDTKCDLYLCVYGNILSLSYGTQHHYESNLLQLEINFVLPIYPIFFFIK